MLKEPKVTRAGEFRVVQLSYASNACIGVHRTVENLPGRQDLRFLWPHAPQCLSQSDVPKPHEVARGSGRVWEIILSLSVLGGGEFQGPSPAQCQRAVLRMTVA